MSRAMCDGCGNYRRIELEIRTDGEVNRMLGERNYCWSCGAFIAGVIETAERTAFKRAPAGEVKRDDHS